MTSAPGEFASCRVSGRARQPPKAVYRERVAGYPLVVGWERPPGTCALAYRLQDAVCLPRRGAQRRAQARPAPLRLYDQGWKRAQAHRRGAWGPARCAVMFTRWEGLVWADATVVAPAGGARVSVASGRARADVRLQLKPPRATVIGRLYVARRPRRRANTRRQGDHHFCGCDRGTDRLRRRLSRSVAPIWTAVSLGGGSARHPRPHTSTRRVFRAPARALRGVWGADTRAGSARCGGVWIAADGGGARPAATPPRT
jgi:hypothetical protein